MLKEIFMAWKFGIGFFGGYILVQASFGFSLLPPFDHPCQLKSGVPPPPAIMRQIMAQSIRSLAVIMVVKQLSCPELEERFGYAVKSWTKSSSRLVTNSCRRVLFSSRQFIESTRRLVKLSRWVVESSRRVVYITYKSIARIFSSDSSTRRVAL